MRKLLSFMLIIFISSTAIVFGFATGVYVEPKVSFMARTDTFPSRVDSLNIGGGIAFGYDFFRSTRFLPLRVDLEYNGMGRLKVKDSSFHTLLLNVYYDVNIFSLSKNSINDTTLKGLYEREPFMALFLVLSFGGRYQTSIINAPAGSETPNSLILYQYKETITSFLFGVGAGGVINFNRTMGLTLTYKFFIGPSVKQGHEVLLGLRFTVPRNTK